MKPIPLGPFDVTEPIGRGGMGRVWAARHREQGIELAIKVLSNVALSQPGVLVGFRNEVRSTASLDHPNIVVVHDYGEVGAEAAIASEGLLPAGSPWLAMERIRGTSLHPLRGRLPWERMARVLLSLLDALAHAHARGVIHRDIKPANVLLDKDSGAVKLTDFGLAHALVNEGDPDEADEIVGTPSYMAPEQITGDWRDHGPWTDLYALGCLAYALACGQPPFRSGSSHSILDAQLNCTPPRLRPLHHVPRGFESWVDRLLQKSPTRRYRRAADAAWDLLALGESNSLPPLGEVTLTTLGPVTGDPDDTTLRLEPPEGRLEAGGEPRRLDTPPLPGTWRRPPHAAPTRLKGAGLDLFGLRALPLVGRARELDRLWSALRQAHELNRPRLVELRGPAGVGKSRLAEWIGQRAHEVGAASIAVANHSPSPGPGDGVGPMLARAWQIEGLSQREARRGLARALGWDPTVPNDDLDAITELICPSREGPVRLSSPSERHATAGRALDLLAGPRAQCVWLDDAHLSPDTLAFARHLLMHGPRATLLLLTVRDEDLGQLPRVSQTLDSLQGLPGTERIELGPLSGEAWSELVAQLLVLDPDLAALLEERAAGNPLFAVQLVSDWVERGLLVPAEQGFALTAGAPRTLPRDVRAVWSAHVERLVEGCSVEDRMGLELAAVLGQAVVASEWAQACREAGIAPPWRLIERLIERRLARPGSGGPQLGWSFVHSMLRECIEHEAEVAGRRPAHHRVCANMLKSTTGHRAADRVGRHLVAAGDDEGALDALYRGANNLIETGHLSAARAILAERRAAAERCGLDEADSRWGGGWSTASRLHLIEGDWKGARRYAERLLAGAERHGWTRWKAWACCDLGSIHISSGLPEKARSYLEQALDVARALPADHWLAAKAHTELARVYTARGDYASAESYYERAWQIAEGAGLDNAMAIIAQRRSASFKRQGLLLEARRLLQTAHQAYKRAGYRNGVAITVNDLADLDRLEGDLVSAEAGYREAHRLFQAIGSGSSLVASINLGMLLAEQASYGEAMSLLRPALEQARDREVLHFLPIVEATMLVCHAGTGDWAAWDQRIETLCWTGEVAPELDTPRCLRLAARLAREAGQPERAATASGLAAEQWVALGRPDEADRDRR